MDKTPLVSVVIPAYNAVRFVNATIDSVLAQTFQDFEILAVDDGSTDNTKEILEAYGDKIRYLPKKNGGVSSARNYGIEKAKGKYIAFLDADDVWMPEKLEKQVALMDSKEDVGLCYVATQKVDEELNYLNSIPANAYDDYTRSLLLNLNIVSGSCSSAMVRHDVISQTDGFDSQFTTYADWEMWLRLSLLTNCAPINEELVKYRMVKGSMSSNPEVTKRDARGVLEKFFNLAVLPEKYRTLEKQAYSNHLMIVSGEFLHNGKVRESVNCIWQGVKLYPQNIARPLGLPFRFAKRLLAN
ncbi:MAG: glycosyltransferase family 2 protein [Pyrinomonadaceae bacterium]